MRALLLLGMVQGLTEFLPISSSGHLVVLRAWLGITAPGASLEVALHLGTLAAVVYVYRHWLASLVRGLWARDRSAWRTLGLLTWASIPAAGVGILLGRWIETYFVMGAVTVGWLSTALLLWTIPAPTSGDHPLEAMSWRAAWLIGLAQALALWPGLSRSGSTIAMARILHIDGVEAARFSFLMAIPAVVGATIFELPHVQTSGGHLLFWGVGALAAGVCGVVAIQWILRIVNRPHAWRGFSVYLLTACAAVWIFGG